MNCRYCGSWNAEDEHRCDRCGRRLTSSAYATTQGAAALALQPADEAPKLLRVETSNTAAPSGAQQGTLFGLPASRVIRFPHARMTSRSDPAPGIPAQTRSQTVRRSPRRPPIESQQNLEFASPSIAQPASVSRHIYCDARVAPATLRVIAAAIDIGIILAGLLLFAFVFWYGGGSFVFNSWTTPSFVVAALLIIVLYRALCWIAMCDTPGMQSAGLRLVDFDGYSPRPGQRLKRLAASFLSVGAAGLGMLWGLADEESLTWHDHISKTFPTTAGR